MGLDCEQWCGEVISFIINHLICGGQPTCYHFFLPSATIIINKPVFQKFFSLATKTEKNLIRYKFLTYPVNETIIYLQKFHFHWIFIARSSFIIPIHNHGNKAEKKEVSIHVESSRTTSTYEVNRVSFFYDSFRSFSFLLTKLVNVVAAAAVAAIICTKKSGILTDSDSQTDQPAIILIIQSIKPQHTYVIMKFNLILLWITIRTRPQTETEPKRTHSIPQSKRHSNKLP